AEDRVNDGVATVIIGSNDYAAAWAVDNQGRALHAAVPGGEQQREMAYRFGINLVMYALTGNYKSDQVHVPAILERLGQWWVAPIRRRWRPSRRGGRSRPLGSSRSSSSPSASGAAPAALPGGRSPSPRSTQPSSTPPSSRRSASRSATSRSSSSTN